ncbi:hypothetical protein ACS0TY_021026 [Phlomoides rotata]
MGLIEDGSISGVLPSSSEAFVVHYPGYPSSIERAIETLGGTPGILKARTEKSNKLKVYFRPEDPYSHPAFGELQPCTNFLLKISKKKVKDTQNVKDPDRISGHASADSLQINQNNVIPQSTETTEHIVQPDCKPVSASSEVNEQIHNGAEEQLSADIVARVSEAYHFDGMVDYQHVLAVHADSRRSKKRNLADLEPQLGGLMDVDQEDLMIILPPLFSLKDRPEKLILKSSGDPSLKKIQEEVVEQRSEMKMKIEQCLAIDFNIKEIPKKVNWENYIPRNSDLWQWQTAMCELFEERPIWIKHSVAEHLLDRGVNVGDKILRRLLFIAAYYFSNGPFLRFWIRKGYDPRKDPESRIYQRTDFRVPPSLRLGAANLAFGSKSRWEDICAFRVFPRKAQTSMQLFELKDDYIQQEIRKPTTQENCSLQNGWFSSHVLDILRLRVAQRFLAIYPEAGAESILRFFSNRIERLKKLPLSTKNLKADKEGKQIDKEVLESEDKETNDDIEFEEEEEEDEMEDENLGEDVDVDEALDLADQQRNFPLPDSYTEHDSISKDYLQDLFGSFPNGSASEVLDSDPYDGGYEIYDQYSDGNLSDDDF